MTMKMIKNILRGTVLALILLVLVGGTVFAAYSYYANIQVLETDGNSYTYLPVIADVDNDYLSDNNYISLTGLDTRVLAGSTELKHLVVDDSVLFVAPTVGANSTGNYKYTLNNTSDLDSFPVIVGYDGYITIPSEIGDDMQLGDDFEIEFDGYVDTSSGSDKNLIYKGDAFTVLVGVAGEISAAIPGSAGTWFSPDGYDDTEGTWTDETLAYDENAATYAYSNVPGASYNDFLTLEITERLVSSIRFDAFYNAAQISKAWIEVYYDEGWHNIYSTSFADHAWVEVELDDVKLVSKARIMFYNPSGLQKQAKLYEFDFGIVDAKVTATGISSGEHTIKAYADGTDLGIIVDEGEAGEVSDTTLLSGASVPDNANDIIINQNNVMPYFDYLKWTVSDTLIAWYQPISMIVGTTLDDREGTDAGETGTAEEDATITWGANPAGVDAAIGSLVSSSQPEIAPAAGEEAVDVLPEGEIPAGGVVDTAALEDNPMYFLVEFISDNADLTEEQIWFGGATLLILLAMGIAVARVPNHLLLAGTIGLVFSGFFLAMHIYQFWMVIIFGFVWVASLIMERKPVI